MTAAQIELPGIHYDEIVSWLRQQTWSDFARSLVADADARGLSLGQLKAAESFKAKIDAREAAKAKASTPKMPVPAETPVPIGTFTVEHDDGGYHTFRTDVQPADSDFAPGQVVMSYLAGRDNESDYRGFAFVQGTPTAPRLVVWKRFRDNAELLADAQVLLDDPASVLTAKHCIACGRKLTVPSSVHAGLGPECAKRYGS